MSAAILQGTPATTIDTDIWLDLPERQYVRALDIAIQLGGQALAKTVVALRDGSLVNFLYRVDGLASFSTEYRRAAAVEIWGAKVKVIPLERIIRSKEFVGREKDIAHLPLLRATLAAKTNAQPKGQP